MPFARGIPSHDTLCEVIAALDPDLFKTCFTNWVDRLRIAGPDTIAPDTIAIDGKTSRRSHARSKGRGLLHTVSAWATRQQLVLGQEVVCEKSNEIIAIPLLLQCLELAGAIVTIDAMGTQTQIAQTILDGGGNYVLALKQNRPATFAEVEALFAAPPRSLAIGVHRTIDGDHRDLIAAAQPAPGQRLDGGLAGGCLAAAQCWRGCEKTTPLRLSAPAVSRRCAGLSLWPAGAPLHCQTRGADLLPYACAGADDAYGTGARGWLTLAHPEPV